MASRVAAPSVNDAMTVALKLWLKSVVIASASSSERLRLLTDQPGGRLVWAV